MAEIPVKHCVSAGDAEQIQVPFPLKVTMAAAMRKKAQKKYFILAAQKPFFRSLKLRTQDTKITLFCFSQPKFAEPDLFFLKEMT